MDRRGHAMQGMDSVYIHVTDDMRRQLCNYLEGLWQQGIAERYKLAPHSAVPLLGQALVAYARKQQNETSTQQRLRAARTQVQTRSRGLTDTRMDPRNEPQNPAQSTSGE